MTISLQADVRDSAVLREQRAAERRVLAEADCLHPVSKVVERTDTTTQLVCCRCGVALSVVTPMVEFEGETVRWMELSVQDRKAFLAGGFPY